MCSFLPSPFSISHCITFSWKLSVYWKVSMNLDFQDGVSKLPSQAIQALSQLLGNPVHFLMYPTIYHFNCHCAKTHFLQFLRGRAPCRAGLLGLMLCCHHLEILNTFWKRGPAFSFCSGRWKLYSQSWLSGPYLASVTRSSIDNQGSSNYLSHNSFLCSLFAQNSLKYRLLKRSFRTHSTWENSLHALKQHICF